jgi:hypothetical protein
MGRNVRGAYPPDWPAIATAVKEDAGWRCVRCGHPHERPAERVPCDERCDLERHPEFRPPRALDLTMPEHARPTLFLRGGRRWVLAGRRRQRVLTVAHLDDDKANCRWWNLAALCQVCHLSTQSRIEMQRTWVLEHSAWFHPYVAGFYAWRYLGEDLSRLEVEARLDELLELERRHVLGTAEERRIG